MIVVHIESLRPTVVTPVLKQRVHRDRQNVFRAPKMLLVWPPYLDSGLVIPLVDFLLEVVSTEKHCLEAHVSS